MLASLDRLNQFDIDNSSLTLWAFKKYAPADRVGPIYTGHWIELTEDLEEALKSSLAEARKEIKEIFKYSLLVQNNESSALSISVEETWSQLIIEQAAEPTEERRIKDLKKIRNAEFYVVRYIVGDKMIYGVRKTDSSWQSKKNVGIMTAIFRNNQLALDEQPRFIISKYFDFYIVGETILISNKSAFESVLSFKQAHVEEFLALQAEVEFTELFSNLAPLINFVGENKIHLRRISAIRMKGYYRNAEFIERLRKEYTSLGLAINFDCNGKIISTPENCRDIIQALLDHRLDSRLSRNLYDVDNVATVRLGGA